MRTFLRLDGLIVAAAVAGAVALVVSLSGPPASTVKMPPSVVVDRSPAQTEPRASSASGVAQGGSPPTAIANPSAKTPGPSGSTSAAHTSSPTPEGGDPSAATENVPSPPPTPDT
jgi:hypothetical protein